MSISNSNKKTLRQVLELGDRISLKDILSMSDKLSIDLAASLTKSEFYSDMLEPVKGQIIIT